MNKLAIIKRVARLRENRVKNALPPESLNRVTVLNEKVTLKDSKPRTK